MTAHDILSAANAEGFSPRFRRWLSFILSWEIDLDAHGNIQVETLGDGAGITFAGLTSRDDGLTSLPTPLWIAQTYLTKYWEPSRAENLPPPVGEVVANYAVNCGLGRAGRFLQASLADYGVHLEIDGQIGMATVKAAWSVPVPKDLAQGVIAKSGVYYNSIAQDGRRQWLRGWINRNKSLTDFFCV